MLATITVTTRNYLHRTRALMSQVERLVPKSRRIVFCVDDFSDYTNSNDEPFELISLSEIGVPRFKHIVFGHCPTGVCCIMKPFAAMHAIKTLGATRCIYIDNDVSVYRNPIELIAALENDDFVITPHITSPVVPPNQPDERLVHKYGIYNAGIFACTNSLESIRFLEWWAAHMLNPANIDPKNGWDQVWLAFSMCFVEKCRVLRDLGYNVAAWNLYEREISENDGVFMAGESPLTAMHFSGFNESNPRAMYHSNVTCTNIPNEATGQLCDAFYESLVKAGLNECKDWGYEFARFSDGELITASHRDYLRNAVWHDLTDSDDPFSIASPIAQQIRATERANANSSSINRKLVGLTNLLRSLFAVRQR